MSIEREIGALFHRQHGVATRPQVQLLGAGRKFVQVRVADGRWAAEGRLVLRHTATSSSPMQRLWIARLGSGASAVVSHRSAAWLWDLCPPPPDHDVIVARSTHLRQPVANVHRPVDYPSRPVQRRHLLVTDPLRTIVDVAAVSEEPALRDILDRALSLGLVTVAGVLAERGRAARRGRLGLGRLSVLLSEVGAVDGPTPSFLELRSLRLFRSGGLDPISRERSVGEDGRYRVDFVIGERVIVEVDGWAYHSSPTQKAADERRRNGLRLDGFLVLVYTWRDIVGRGDEVLLEIRRALAATASAAR